jgi:hypothetical protein
VLNADFVVVHWAEEEGQGSEPRFRTLVRNRGKLHVYTYVQCPRVIPIVLHCIHARPTPVIMLHERIGVQSLIGDGRPASSPFRHRTSVVRGINTVQAGSASE